MMCRGKVILKNNFILNSKIKERLTSLLADGLIHLEGDTIQITEVGKSFLRNVCMSFDERLQKTKERDNLFSQAI